MCRNCNRDLIIPRNEWKIFFGFVNKALPYALTSFKAWRNWWSTHKERITFTVECWTQKRHSRWRFNCGDCNCSQTICLHSKFCEYKTALMLVNSKMNLNFSRELNSRFQNISKRKATLNFFSECNRTLISNCSSKISHEDDRFTVWYGTEKNAPNPLAKFMNYICW